ncbi:hypothetical protein [Actinoplanes sp. G11-F43]|uniref:hypothetical protein n=1 Tax=Actinoplanes sp. G11-F43 TaxID=3424130 RepID=UPI003D32CCB5
MAIAHIAVLSAALSALLIFPCAATILLSGKPSDLRRILTRDGRKELRARDLRERSGSRHLARRRRRIDRGPRSRGDRTTIRRLDRGLRSWDQARLAALRPPAIEQIAFDLRRLDHQRRNPPFHSEVLLVATMRSYDARLRLACGCLGIEEFLEPLDGIERDIERARIELELAAAGLVFRHDPGPPT